MTHGWLCEATLDYRAISKELDFNIATLPPPEDSKGENIQEIIARHNSIIPAL